MLIPQDPALTPTPTLAPTEIERPSVPEAPTLSTVLLETPRPAFTPPPAPGPGVILAMMHAFSILPPLSHVAVMAVAELVTGPLVSVVVLLAGMATDAETLVIDVGELSVAEMLGCPPST